MFMCFFGFWDTTHVHPARDPKTWALLQDLRGSRKWGQAKSSSFEFIPDLVRCRDLRRAFLNQDNPDKRS
eukprot:1742888-Amphidinium_carterae.1